MKQLRLKKNPDVVLRHVAGEILLIPVKGALADLQNLFVLEGIGEAVWERLDAETRLSTIANDLAAQYGRATEELQDDCGEFVEALLAEGLAEEV